MNQQAGARQTGFTLVEVLVVVVIISLLIGLATPALVIALRKTEVATMRIELSLVEQALEAYRNEYGEYPPDFTDVNDENTHNQNVIDHLNRLFPRRRELLNVNELKTYFKAANLPGPSGKGGLFPDQALLFWLRGFHPNPQYPITGDTTGDHAVSLDGEWTGDNVLTEREPLMEFNNKMIGSVTSVNDLPPGESWVDDFNLETPGEVLVLTRAPRSPIVYFDSRGNYFEPTLSEPTKPKQFLVSDNGVEKGTAMPYMSDRSERFMNPKTFQLISAGQDSHFGNYNGNPKHYPGGTNYDDYDADNLTNFSSGTLGEDKDSQP